jgi:predicted Fe-S protein YdhL (DUF1289 family)
VSDAVDPGRCPLCGRVNACGIAGPAPCWCTQLAIPKATLDSIPEAARGLACLCRACAAGCVASPCIGVCVLDAATATCRGCKRTVAEIQAWPSCSDDDKRQILQRVRLRFVTAFNKP